MSWFPPSATAVLALALVGSRTVFWADRGGASDALLLEVVMVILAAGAGFALDDPAEPTIEASPIPRADRWSLRVGIAALAWGSSWVTALIVAAHWSGPLPVSDLTVEAVGWMGLALSAASIAGGPAASPTLLVAFVARPLLPDDLDLLGMPGSPEWAAIRLHWLVVIVCTVAVFVFSGRDPARRRWTIGT